MTNVFHAGDGNLHPLLSFDRRVPGTLERVLKASEEIVRLCVDAGGALSGEHGIGLEKRDFMPLVYSEHDLAAQACVRAVFDPSGTDEPAQDPARGRDLRRARDCRWDGRGAGRGGYAGGVVDLIHPHGKGDVVEALVEATERRRRVLVVGGRRHMDKGNPCEVDAELWTTMLDRLVYYEPAEMVAVVESGMRVGELQRMLAEGGQEWPVDAPEDATVGGVIGPRRARQGAWRSAPSATRSSSSSSSPATAGSCVAAREP